MFAEEVFLDFQLSPKENKVKEEANRKKSVEKKLKKVVGCNIQRFNYVESCSREKDNYIQIFGWNFSEKL